MRRNDGDWFPLSSDYPMHRKTLHLIDILGERSADAYPVRLMAWLRDQENVDGRFRSITEVEAAARWAGEKSVLVAALQDSGFLDGLTYHGWATKGGRSVSRMLARRVQAARSLQTECAQSVEVPSPSPSTSTSPERPEGPKGRAAERTFKYPDDFEAFYRHYPRKTSKGAALKAWNKLASDEKSAATTAIQKQASWPCFAEAPPDKQPHPATWLSARRWEDEAPQSSVPSDHESARKQRMQEKMRHKVAEMQAHLTGEGFNDGNR